MKALFPGQAKAYTRYCFSERKFSFANQSKTFRQSTRSQERKQIKIDGG